MNSKRRPKRLLFLVILLVAGWLVFMVWLAFQPQRTPGSLGIDDESDHGAAAITSVLAEQHVQVRPAQTMHQLRKILADHPQALVLFHDRYQALATASYERLEALAELVPPQQRVFAGLPDGQHEFLLDGIQDSVSLGFVEHLEAAPDCQITSATTAGHIWAIRQGVLLDDTAHGCFGVEDDTSGEPLTAYAFAQTGDGSIIFADWRMLSNEGLYQNGTATLALWTLGRTDTVVWFQPNFQFEPDADGKLSPVQLPDWARMSLVWAVIVTGVFLLYRGRRTGPVVTEPLPTEVPAAETIVGRGRMYARQRHHAHALEHLQQASLFRVARILQLGSRAVSKTTILVQAANRLGRPIGELQALYSKPTQPLSHAAFVTWATNVQDFEDQLRNHVSAPAKESQ